MPRPKSHDKVPVVYHPLRKKRSYLEFLDVSISDPATTITHFPSCDLKKVDWGRNSERGTWIRAVGCAGIILLSPLLVLFFWFTINVGDGSLTGMLKFFWEVGWEVGLVPIFELLGPRLSVEISAYYFSWLAFQASLFTFLPGKTSVGQHTPDGNLLHYKTNGLTAWICTHIIAITIVVLELVSPTVIAENFGALMIAANIYGILVAGTTYLKAVLNPSVGEKRFSKSWIYDLYMGVELNPRFGDFDFKLFQNGRPGIIAWTLIDLSFMAQQYCINGFVTRSMFVTTNLHLLYVVDFFVHEDWYLRTIDICHDHFGFYLAWGSAVWLPCMYTLQTQYLVKIPVELSPNLAFNILVCGFFGYWIFRSSNNQKDLARRADGKCLIWGSRAKVLRVKYETTDRIDHKSLLLISGWWKYSRHPNYLGDLIMAYSMCATCGFRHLLPWTYAIFMTVLLIHRSRRVEQRCSQKYGKYWDAYCKQVRWVLVPGLY